jgi:hypothetical protein
MKRYRITINGKVQFQSASYMGVAVHRALDTYKESFFNGHASVEVHYMGPVKYEYVLVGDVPCDPPGSVKRDRLVGYGPFPTKGNAKVGCDLATEEHPEIKRINYRRVEKESK